MSSLYSNNILKKKKGKKASKHGVKRASLSKEEGKTEKADGNYFSETEYFWTSKTVNSMLKLNIQDCTGKFDLKIKVFKTVLGNAIRSTAPYCKQGQEEPLVTG